MSLLCFRCWYTSPQMKWTCHAISLMSPSGCYIKAQLRDRRLEERCTPNVMTFLLKSTTQPLHSVTWCITLTQVFFTSQRECVYADRGPGSVKSSSSWGWFRWAESTSVERGMSLRLISCLLFIRGVSWSRLTMSAITQFNLSTCPY